MKPNFRNYIFLTALLQFGLCNPAHSLAKALNTAVDVFDEVGDETEIIIGAPAAIECLKGEHFCSSPFPFFTNASNLQHAYTFEDGTDYQNLSTWNGDLSVNKVFGATDCGFLGQTDEGNSVMIGWRDLQKPYANLIELTGFINRKPNDLFKDGLYFQYGHLIVIPRNQKINLGIQTVGDASSGYYLISAGADTNLIMARRCSQGNPHFNGRTVSSWFGGVQAAPETMHLKDQNLKFPSVSQTFPKKLKIADQENLCNSGINPVTYLQNHASGIYEQYRQACGVRNTLTIQVLGCDQSDEIMGTQGLISINDGVPAFRYLIGCDAH